jgi:hypothetical protein
MKQEIKVKCNGERMEFNDKWSAISRFCQMTCHYRHNSPENLRYNYIIGELFDGETEIDDAKYQSA